MAGKLQLAILSAALMFGGALAHEVATAASNDSRVLYLAAQYKIFRGDAESAAQLLRKAAMVTQIHPSISSGNCAYPQRAESESI